MHFNSSKKEFDKIPAPLVISAHFYDKFTESHKRVLEKESFEIREVKK